MNRKILYVLVIILMFSLIINGCQFMINNSLSIQLSNYEKRNLIRINAWRLNVIYDNATVQTEAELLEKVGSSLNISDMIRYRWNTEETWWELNISIPIYIFNSTIPSLEVSK